MDAYVKACSHHGVPCCAEVLTCMGARGNQTTLGPNRAASHDRGGLPVQRRTGATDPSGMRGNAAFDDPECNRCERCGPWKHRGSDDGTRLTLSREGSDPWTPDDVVCVAEALHAVAKECRADPLAKPVRVLDVSGSAMDVTSFGQLVSTWLAGALYATSARSGVAAPSSAEEGAPPPFVLRAEHCRLHEGHVGVLAAVLHSVRAGLSPHGGGPSDAASRRHGSPTPYLSRRLDPPSLPTSVMSKAASVQHHAASAAGSPSAFKRDASTPGNSAAAPVARAPPWCVLRLAMCLEGNPAIGRSAVASRSLLQLLRGPNDLPHNGESDVMLTATTEHGTALSAAGKAAREVWQLHTSRRARPTTTAHAGPPTAQRFGGGSSRGFAATKFRNGGVDPLAVVVPPPAVAIVHVCLARCGVTWCTSSASGTALPAHADATTVEALGTMSMLLEGSLSLIGNALGGGGVATLHTNPVDYFSTALCPGYLAHSHSLTSLDLSRTQLQDAQADALSRALLRNAFLRSIAVRHNGFTDVGALRFVDVLVQCSNLERVLIGLNDGVRLATTTASLLVAARSAVSLRHFDVEGFPFIAEGAAVSPPPTDVDLQDVAEYFEDRLGRGPQAALAERQLRRVMRHVCAHAAARASSSSASAGASAAAPAGMVTTHSATQSSTALDHVVDCFVDTCTASPSLRTITILRRHTTAEAEEATAVATAEETEVNGWVARLRDAIRMPPLYVAIGTHPRFDAAAASGDALSQERKGRTTSPRRNMPSPGRSVAETPTQTTNRTDDTCRQQGVDASTQRETPPPPPPPSLREGSPLGASPGALSSATSAAERSASIATTLPRAHAPVPTPARHQAGPAASQPIAASTPDRLVTAAAPAVPVSAVVAEGGRLPALLQPVDIQHQIDLMRTMETSISQRRELLLADRAELEDERQALAQATDQTRRMQMELASAMADMQRARAQLEHDAHELRRAQNRLDADRRRTTEQAFQLALDFLVLGEERARVALESDAVATDASLRQLLIGEVQREAHAEATQCRARLTEERAQANLELEGLRVVARESGTSLRVAVMLQSAAVEARDRAEHTASTLQRDLDAVTMERNRLEKQWRDFQPRQLPPTSPSPQPANRPPSSSSLLPPPSPVASTPPSRTLGPASHAPHVTAAAEPPAVAAPLALSMEDSSTRGGPLPPPAPAGAMAAAPSPASSRDPSPTASPAPRPTAFLMNSAATVDHHLGIAAGLPPLSPRRTDAEALKTKKDVATTGSRDYGEEETGGGGRFATTTTTMDVDSGEVDAPPPCAFAPPADLILCDRSVSESSASSTSSSGAFAVPPPAVLQDGDATSLTTANGPIMLRRAVPPNASASPDVRRVGLSGPQSTAHHRHPRHNSPQRLGLVAPSKEEFTGIRSRPRSRSPPTVASKEPDDDDDVGAAAVGAAAGNQAGPGRKMLTPPASPPAVATNDRHELFAHAAAVVHLPWTSGDAWIHPAATSRTDREDAAFVVDEVSPPSSPETSR